MLETVPQTLNLAFLPLPHGDKLVRNCAEFSALIGFAATNAVIVAVRITVMNPCRPPQCRQRVVSCTVCTIALRARLADLLIRQPFFDCGVKFAPSDRVAQICNHHFPLCDCSVSHHDFVPELLLRGFATLSIGCPVLPAYFKLRPVQTGMVFLPQLLLALIAAHVTRTTPTDDMVTLCFEHELLLKTAAFASRGYRTVERVVVHGRHAFLGTMLPRLSH
ncbi:hypothetical protein [Mycobacterium sp. IS-1264]|uniref:hypothetical protein n=1 Tax=Mycobacterium sp. IS-1264 TaxID=1834158 RepID=UPI001115A2D6|nr:hypothetical protein [Mycobacterium sp. IS-1264]